MPVRPIVLSSHTYSWVFSLLLCSLNAFQAPVWCVMLLVNWMTPYHLCLGSVWELAATMAGTSVNVSTIRPALLDSAIITRWPLCLNGQWTVISSCHWKYENICILYNMQIFKFMIVTFLALANTHTHTHTHTNYRHDQKRQNVFFFFNSHILNGKSKHFCNHIWLYGHLGDFYRYTI